MTDQGDAGPAEVAGPVFDSYVIAATPAAAPPAGARLALRRSGPLGLALHTRDGHRVGLLPPAEAEALRRYLGAARRLRARVRAVVPCRLRPRILVRFEGG
jgi:hypothetical protein